MTAPPPGADAQAPVDVPPDATIVSRAAFRDAMALLGAAVHVITSDGPGGRAGFTASAVCSVSDTPPTLLVCLNRGVSAYAAFLANDALCVNTLAAAHEPLSDRFGSHVTMDERFDAGTWSTLATGAAVLDGAMISFDCRVVQRIEVGTHSVLICAVQALHRGTGDAALMYYGRRYHSLG